MAYIEIPCPILQTKAEQLAGSLGGSHVDVLSPRTWGKYRIYLRARLIVEDFDTISRERLTTWLVNQRFLGNEVPEIDISVTERINDQRPLSVSERRTRMAQYLLRQSNHAGQWIRVAGQATEEIQNNIWGIMAATESVEDLEIRYLIEHLIRIGHAEKRTPDARDIRLTPEGYAFLESLEGRNVGSPQAFVAMWFDPSMESAYIQGFEKAILDCGYECLRIDRVEHVNKIDDEIIAAIRRSRFLVADFTCGVIEQEGKRISVARGGVYYEAGFAQGLDIPVIWTCRENAINDVHFDTRQFNHITWRDPNDLYTKLKNRISAVIGDGPKKGLR